MSTNWRITQIRAHWGNFKWNNLSFKHKQKSVEVQICLEFDFNLASVSNVFHLPCTFTRSLKTISQFHVCKIGGKIWQHKKVTSHKNMITQKLHPKPKCWKLKPSKMLPHVRIWQVTLHSLKKFWII